MSITSERVKPPEIDKMPPSCPVCDMMVTLGISNAVCETLPPGEKQKCHQLIKPLEDKKKSAVDTLASILIELGDDNMNLTLDRMNSIIWQATEKAKEQLIATGKINIDGSPKQ
jgi:hypothetical protein